MKKIVLAAGMFLTLMGKTSAQDIHFTQYFTSPLTLNPAMTGLLAEDLRFAANYRSQWSSVSSNPYTTGTFSVDVATLRNKLPEGDALGIGLMAEYDKAGSGGLTNTTAGLSLAYHKAFGRDRINHLSMGLQTFYVQKTLDFSKLTTEDMFDMSTATLAYPNLNGSSKGLAYPDFNAGVMYSGKVTEKTTGYIGYSYYHLTQPVESFFGDSHQIHKRQTLYLGGSFEMNDKATLYASGLYQAQGGAKEVLIGSAIGFVMNTGHDPEYRRNTILYMGGWYRYGDAISPYIAIEWTKMRIGLNYDVTVSRFAPATSNSGGYELSLLFFGNLNRHEKPQTYDWSCPKF